MSKVQPNNYKTMLCKYYAQGYCKNTTSCTFAHGGEDIQNSEQQPVFCQPVNQQQNFPSQPVN